MFVAGIDAHTRYVVVVVLNSSAEVVLRPVRVSSDRPERLVELLAPFRPLEAVVETSSSWPWLHEILGGAGITFVLAHAKKLRAIAEASYKSDAIDATLLARMQLARLIPAVYATPKAQREWATLLRHRTRLVSQRTALANRIHAQLHAHGLHVARGHLLTKAGRRTLRTEAGPMLTPEERRLVRTHLRLIVHLTKLIRALDRRITQVAGPIPEAQLLRTIPGIGAQRSLVLCAETLPIRRFPTPGHLASYAGLVPTSKQSGVRAVRHGAIPMGANRWLRGVFVRAVVSHVQHAPESWLTQYYLAQKPRIGWQAARIATARKLARAVHAMLRTNTAWSSERKERSEPMRGELHSPHAAMTA